MTAPQKWITVLGALLIVATLFFAPHHFTAHNEVATLLGRDERAEGTFYAPVWSSAVPTSTFDWNPSYRADSADLDAGKLGLWWGGIAIVSVVGIVLAAPKRAG